MALKIKRLTETAILPTRAHEDDVGLDLYADEHVEIHMGARKLVSCGIAVQIPRGYVGDVRPRSGLAVDFGITVLNSPGTIDPGYRGEVKVLLINHGKYNYEINPGTRIAQLVLVLCNNRDVKEVEELDPAERDTAGFGSSGV